MAKDGTQLSEDSSIKKSIELAEAGEDKEFYEEIEAPKFVDFTVPDHYQPDDRYWFCLRVGCDQKHEEEIDPEAISRNFVLRVMAARSPNVRLHKALSRNASSKNMKCPLSAPSKSAKSRVPRLAIVSMSQKMGAVDKEKVKLLPRVSSTPRVKGKQVTAKYLTTPRNKRIPPNPESFRSVQNPKPPTVAVPKRLVAKALVFHSPKKAISLKTSVELRSPLTKLCQGMKKLEITSERKCALGYSSKPSKHLEHDSQKSLPLQSSTRQKVNKEKSRTKTSDHTYSQNDQGTKSARSGKCKSKRSLKEIIQNDCSEETIMKSRDDTEEHLAASKISGHCTATDSEKEAAFSVSDVDSILRNVCEIDSSNKSAQVRMGGNDIPRFQASNKENDSIEGSPQKNSSTKVSFENKANLNDHLTEFEMSKGARCEGEMTQSADKENASAFDENRRVNHNNIQTGKKILGTKKIDKKVAVDKISKGSATIGAPGVKLMKPKPTNPKPFRLRTDERGILREANLDRKNQAVTPQKEAAIVSKLHSGDMQGHRGDIQKGSRTPAEKTPKGQGRKKTPTTVRDQCYKHQVLQPLISILESNTCEDLDNDSRKTNTPSRHVLQPHRKKETASKITSDKQLCVTVETPSEDLKPLEKECSLA